MSAASYGIDRISGEKGSIFVLSGSSFILAFFLAWPILESVFCSKTYSLDQGREDMKLGFVGIALFAGSFLLGQEPLATDHDRARIQIKCEKKILRSLKAKEIRNGADYEIFRGVIAAFELTNSPRLYFSPEDGNAYYVAGSVFSDGKGKILISRRFAAAMGDEALAGVMAHEMAHLVADDGAASCMQMSLRDPAVEEAADILAFRKVGFSPMKAFLSRVQALTGSMNGDTASRLRVLEKIEARKNGQR